jgi:hypothetical protein
VAFVKKENKNGGSFWVAPGVSAVKDGSKQHFPAFLQDSAFLEKDIKLFLDKKPWETITPISMDKSQEIPF